MNNRSTVADGFHEYVLIKFESEGYLGNQCCVLS